MLEDQKLNSTEEKAAQPELPEVENLVGFFDLLITVDRRLNPELYD